ATLYAASAEGFASPLPSFVKSELEGYLECRLLCRGFAVMACTEPECLARHLVAFSCKGRGSCPSCLGRRMAQTAANLIDHVLPEQVPLRQWVLTVPFELRARLAYDGELLGGVSRELGGAVMDFHRRRFELRGLHGGKSGAVTVVQRSSSDLRLNPHYHLVALDGVYDTMGEGAEAEAPTFHALPHLDEVTELPPRAPARDPPYFRSSAVRRKLTQELGPNTGPATQAPTCHWQVG
ncbi:MAG: transposase zinc-binding domain-containing protein, partial [Polyangiaceae bacterium]|nr:transposase zinc-binding domain-containing protein [Polyangiaceae bacterium]